MYRTIKFTKTTILEKRDLSPKILKCFQCKDKEIVIKWVRSQKRYSQKNCWNYWTDSTLEEDKEKHICNNCLIDLYHNKKIYWQVVKNTDKRLLLTNYIYNNKIHKDYPKCVTCKSREANRGSNLCAFCLMGTGQY